MTSAEETAKDVYRALTARDLLRDPTALPAPRHRFLATGDPEPFHRLGPPVPRARESARWTRADGAPREAHGGRLFRHVPGPGIAASCYLVEHDGYRLLLDLGNGSLGALQRHLDPAEVDAVLLSHLHGDHFLDLARLRGPPVRARPAPLPRIPRARAGRHARAAGAGVRPDRRGRAARPCSTSAACTPGCVELGPFRLPARRGSTTRCECTAVRLGGGGRALAYSGDTGPMPTRW